MKTIRVENSNDEANFSKVENSFHVLYFGEQVKILRLLSKDSKNNELHESQPWLSFNCKFLVVCTTSYASLVAKCESIARMGRSAWLTVLNWFPFMSSPVCQILRQLGTFV